MILHTYKPVFSRYIKLISIFSRTYNRMIFKLSAVNIGHKSKSLGIIYIRNHGSITIGENFNIISGKYFNPIGGDTKLKITTTKNSSLVIGNNVGISNSTIYCTKKIIIEDYVMIGGGCKIWDTNFHSIDPVERRLKGDNLINSSEVIIRKFAFIGGSSIILKGVTIGENSVVAAGSVVSKSIPANEIWGGNPAKFIKKLKD